jgi:hypothetical protein
LTVAGRDNSPDIRSAGKHNQDVGPCLRASLIAGLTLSLLPVSHTASGALPFPYSQARDTAYLAAQINRQLKLPLNERTAGHRPVLLLAGISGVLNIGATTEKQGKREHKQGFHARCPDESARSIQAKIPALMDVGGQGRISGEAL